ncbi:hypothetical protein [Saccharomonospora viridis]|nr:hypothetical protein [Saccharomonospora viridis]
MAAAAPGVTDMTCRPPSDGLLCSDFPRDRRVMHPEAVAWTYLMSPLAT